MKRTLFFLFFIALSMIAKAQFTEYIPYTGGSYSTPPQTDYSQYFTPYIPFTGTDSNRPKETVVTGKTFYAEIIYESSTGHKNNYLLPVVVNNGQVRKICFDNGGSVHVGINNSGYKYYGGELDYNRNLDSFVTTVTIVYSNNSWQKFHVYIDASD